VCEQIARLIAMDDRGRVLKAELARPRLDDLATERVQRVDGQVCRRSVELAADFLPQPMGGFGREGDCQDARGIGASIANKVSDPGCDNAGLSTAWAGDDADRSVPGSNRLLLRGGEAIGHTARSSGVGSDEESSTNKDRVVAIGMRVLSLYRASGSAAGRPANTRRRGEPN